MSKRGRAKRSELRSVRWRRRFAASPSSTRRWIHGSLAPEQRGCRGPRELEDNQLNDFEFH